MSFNPLQPTSKAARLAGPPPKNEPACQLLAKLLESPRPHERMPWIRLDDDGQPLGFFEMMVLTDFEWSQCVANAERYVRLICKDDGKEVNQEAWREMFASARMVEVLALAMRQEDDLSKPLFRMPEEIRQHLTGDEIVVLFHNYVDLQERRGPLFRLLTDDEVEQWIERIAEGAEAFPFYALSRTQLVQLLVSTVRRLSTSPTGASSPGSESAASTTAN